MDLARVFFEAVAELSAERLVRGALEARGGLAPEPGGRLVLMGLGKPAAAMLRGARAALNGPLAGAAALPSPAPTPPGVVAVVGSHPVPDRRSQRAAQALCAAADACAPEDAALFLIGGGGSALAALPAPGLALEDKVAATRALLRSGAPIESMNAVRKHLSAIKGGQLGARTRARRALALVLCDVPSGELGAVASGPTLPNATTFADALEAVERFGVALSDAARERLRRGAAGELPETPKPKDAALARIDHLCLAQPADLARTAARIAARLGVPCQVEPQAFAEPVESLARRLAAAARAAAPPLLLALAGEPTVQVPPGAGQGGRMQHLALLLARELAGERFTALCAGSDGRDGETEHCGAVVDGQTAARCAAAGLDLDAALRRFDSAPLCRALGLALPAFPSDTNLCDLVLVRVGP